MFPGFFPYGSHPKISRSIPKFQRKRWVALNLWGNHHEFPVELWFLRICFGYIHVYPIISHLEAQPCIFIIFYCQLLTTSLPIPKTSPGRRAGSCQLSKGRSWMVRWCSDEKFSEGPSWSLVFGCSDAATIGILSYFPTCQVRVVRFYVSCLVLLLLSSPPPLVVLLLSLSSSSSCSTATRDPQCSLSDLDHDHPRPVFPAGPQPRPSTPSVPCRTSTTTIHAQCSLPDLNHDHPRPVFPAGPQPRPSTHSVLCRTSTTTIHAQCSLPDLNNDHPRPVFPAGPQPRPSTPSVPCRTSTASIQACYVFPAGPHVGYVRIYARRYVR